MIRFTRTRIALVVVLPALLGAAVLPSRQGRWGAPLLDQVLTFVALRYADTLSSDVLYEKAAKGLVKELGDPCTEALSPKDMAAFARNTFGRYGGVGMLLSPPMSGYVIVETVFPNTPAASHGVQEGDRIIAIDGADVFGWTVDRVQAKLIGEPGTAVSVSYRRAGVAAPITLQFKRAEIAVPAVPFHLMLDDKIGYVPLTRFSEQTTSDVSAAVRTLVAEGARGLILDLRGNPGGIVDEAFGMANLFLPKASRCSP